MKMSDLDRFKELEKSCGSRYKAINFISDAARYLGKVNSEYHLSESALLAWVIEGKCPFTQVELDARKAVHTRTSVVDDCLEFVDDAEVAARVRSLYKQSLKAKKLMCCEDDDISPGRVSRINILLRMIWYQFNI